MIARRRLWEEADLQLWEVGAWFLFHNMTIALAFWAGVSFGKRIDDESRREIIRAITTNPIDEECETVGAGREERREET